jgi:hypothetical protein
VELYIRCREAILVMGVIVILFLILELKNKNLLDYMEKMICCGIKESNILERRDFNYYMVNVWLKVCITSP